MIYDYKSEELTQEVYIQCICPIVDDIIDEYSTLRRYNDLSILGMFLCLKPSH